MTEPRAPYGAPSEGQVLEDLMERLRTPLPTEEPCTCDHDGGYGRCPYCDGMSRAEADRLAAASALARLQRELGEARAAAERLSDLLVVVAETMARLVETPSEEADHD